MDSKQYEKPYKFEDNRNLKASYGCRVCRQCKNVRFVCKKHNRMIEQYNNTSTASHLNAETSVNREPHCDGPWFQPTDEVLHNVDLLC